MANGIDGNDLSKPKLQSFITRNDGKLDDVAIRVDQNTGAVTLARGSDSITLSADEFRREVGSVRSQLDRTAQENRMLVASALGSGNPQAAGAFSTRLGAALGQVNTAVAPALADPNALNLLNNVPPTRQTTPAFADPNALNLLNNVPPTPQANGTRFNPSTEAAMQDIREVLTRSGVDLRAMVTPSDNGLSSPPMDPRNPLDIPTPPSRGGRQV